MYARSHHRHMQNCHQLVSKQQNFQMIPKTKTKTKPEKKPQTLTFLHLLLGNFHLQNFHLCNPFYFYLTNFLGGRSQDGGGIGLYKVQLFTIEHWANFTRQLLIASWGHQAPRKAAHCLQKEVGQNIKDKKRDKRARDGHPSREESLNRGSFQTPGNPRTGRSGGSLQISEDNLTGRENK